MILNIKSGDITYKKLSDVKTQLKTLDDFEMDKKMWALYTGVFDIKEVNSTKLSELWSSLFIDKKEVKKVFLEFINTYVSKKISITKIKEFLKKTAIPYEMLIELLKNSSWEYTKKWEYILLQKKWEEKSKVFQQQSSTKYDTVETKKGYDYVLFKELKTWEIIVLSKS